jgi:hypothetical protein
MTPVDPTLRGWVIDMSARVLGKRAGEAADGSELLSPAYELLGGGMVQTGPGQMGVAPIMALPPASMPSAKALQVYGGALLDCEMLEQADRTLIVQLIAQAEQAREAMTAQRKAQASGLVIAGADARVNGRRLQ